MDPEDELDTLLAQRHAAGADAGHSVTPAHYGQDPLSEPLGELLEAADQFAVWGMADPSPTFARRLEADLLTRFAAHSQPGVAGSARASAKIGSAADDSATPLMPVIPAADASRAVSVKAAPLHVGATLQADLFGPRRTVVMTSATMTTEGKFDYLGSRLGIERDAATEVAVDSPFDYRRSALLYTVEDMPEPNRPGYQKGLQDAIIGLCEATRGRALVLFTSYSALQATYRAVKPVLEAAGIVVLGQRLDGGPRQLIERFKQHQEMVLFGTSSFWEGVDVVGDALSVLVITKLPFKVPSDPVFQARSEGFAEPFAEFAVPQAVLQFRQGFGRLIRSSTDRGVCAVLESRVLTKRYGRTFLNSLPGCTVEKGRSADLPARAAAWLAMAGPGTNRG